jgi:hypothetical protein
MKKIVLTILILSTTDVFSNTLMSFGSMEEECREVVQGERALGKICVTLDSENKKVYADYYAYDGYALINAKLWAGHVSEENPSKPNDFLINQLLIFKKPKFYRLELDISEMGFECEDIVKIAAQAVYGFENKLCCGVRFHSEIEVFEEPISCGTDGGDPIEGCETAIARPNCPFVSGVEFDETCEGNVFDGSDFTSIPTFPSSNRWGWEIDFPPPIPYEQSLTQTYKLYAGAGQNSTEKGTWVGNVVVDYSDVNALKVTFDMHAGNFLKETHVVGGVLHTGTTAFGKWPSKHGPGTFNPSDELDEHVLTELVNEWSGNNIRSFVTLPQPFPFHVSAHAEVCGPDER